MSDTGSETEDWAARLNAAPLPYAKYLGIEILSATPDRIEGHLPVRQELCTMPDILHGGAIMSFADTLGAMGAFLNLAPGAATTTVESKTNFLAAVPLGQVAKGVTVPVHKGRKLTVWETRIYREDGKLAALVTQSQIVL
ncbi:MAG: PaaI family thioesterase [Alphaproteobacteria bacterium]|nr:PaaI family thioesterase [Alphaproteobacteria bacterium]MBO6629650.1 PaaI family thioesterase [Alphaproteobacteria bacterium]MDF1626877.1 PaaI family thioesterase [Parvibaculaceae bacterium]